MATIYFSGSISGGRGDVAIYTRIVEELEKRGHRVFAGMVTAGHVGAAGEALGAEEIFSRDIGWMEEVARDSGLVVAEVSTPSLGVGYEIAAARYRYQIPVIALYRNGASHRCSAMIAGDPGVRTIVYDTARFDELLEELTRAVEMTTNRPAS